ncbi:hypothetical protein SERLA73DRAFT_63234 [Serpula lacrymans var. lacrymans S7.3]|uniref:Uncharacterized protein n=1 Tax=Serpula lacrymans var. lacrymans (strain S7.3) TaxID=936435 RepID=F8QCI6_SERL3|nr:hypothetical protein SERLA73DRAFT_63234 [Serpula lacrymans var. lacrymans S7.3]
MTSTTRQKCVALELSLQAPRSEYNNTPSSTPICSLPPANHNLPTSQSISPSHRILTSHNNTHTHLPQQSHPLRPECPVQDRLLLWTPPASRINSDPTNISYLTPNDLEKITAVIVNAWASLTRKVYGSGLLAFHAFCNARNISEAEHAPVKSITLASFIATMAGLYSGKTICNYVYGVRAWHILHGSPWIINEPEILALLTVSVTLTPISSKRAPHQPFTIEHICEVRKVLDLTKPLDAAFFACLTTTFYTASRLGEFTIPSINQFDSNRHATIDGVSEVTNRNGFRVKAFILPITKTEKEPMSVSWVTQQGLSDPEEGWLNHIKINNPDSSDHVFAYRWP